MSVRSIATLILFSMLSICSAAVAQGINYVDILCAPDNFVSMLNPEFHNYCKEREAKNVYVPNLTAEDLGTAEIYKIASNDKELIDLIKASGRAEITKKEETYEFFKEYNAIYFDRSSDSGEIMILVNFSKLSDIERLKQELRKFKNDVRFQARLNYYRNVLPEYKKERAALEATAGAGFRFYWRNQNYPNLSSMRINLEAIKVINKVGFPTCGMVRAIQLGESNDHAVPVSVSASFSYPKDVTISLSERYFKIESQAERILENFRLAMARFESSGCKSSSEFPAVSVDQNRAADIVVQLKKDSPYTKYQYDEWNFTNWADAEIMSMPESLEKKKLVLSFGKLLSPVIAGTTWDTTEYAESQKGFHNGVTSDKCESVGTSYESVIYMADPKPTVRFMLNGKGHHAACRTPMRNLSATPYKVVYGDVMTTEGENIGSVVVEFLPASTR
jgi:hypothetical protein